MSAACVVPTCIAQGDHVCIQCGRGVCLAHLRTYKGVRIPICLKCRVPGHFMRRARTCWLVGLARSPSVPGWAEWFKAIHAAGVRSNEPISELDQLMLLQVTERAIPAGEESCPH